MPSTCMLFAKEYIGSHKISDSKILEALSGVFGC